MLASREMLVLADICNGKNYFSMYRTVVASLLTSPRAVFKSISPPSEKLLKYFVKCGKP